MNDGLHFNSHTCTSFPVTTYVPIISLHPPSPQVSDRTLALNRLDSHVGWMRNTSTQTNVLEKTKVSVRGAETAWFKPLQRGPRPSIATNQPAPHSPQAPICPSLYQPSPPICTPFLTTTNVPIIAPTELKLLNHILQHCLHYLHTQVNSSSADPSV